MRHLKAAVARFKREEQSRRFHTWHVAALPLQKKFPGFEEFVKPTIAVQPVPRVAPIQSADQQIATLQAIMKRRKRQ